MRISRTEKKKKGERRRRKRRKFDRDRSFR